MYRTLVDNLNSEATPRQNLYGRLFLILFGVGVIIDLWMVLVLGVDSISWRIWSAQNAHPTLIGAGCIATVVTCWLLRDSDWWESALAGILGGHLFLHWVLIICVSMTYEGLYC